MCACNSTCSRKTGRSGRGGCPCKDAGEKCGKDCVCGKKKRRVVVNWCNNGKVYFSSFINGKCALSVSKCSFGNFFSESLTVGTNFRNKSPGVRGGIDRPKIDRQDRQAINNSQFHSRDSWFWPLHYHPLTTTAWIQCHCHLLFQPETTANAAAAATTTPAAPVDGHNRMEAEIVASKQEVEVSFWSTICILKYSHFHLIRNSIYET